MTSSPLFPPNYMTLLWTRFFLTCLALKFGKFCSNSSNRLITCLSVYCASRSLPINSSRSFKKTILLWLRWLWSTLFALSSRFLINPVLTFFTRSSLIVRLYCSSRIRSKSSLLQGPRLNNNTPSLTRSRKLSGMWRAFPLSSATVQSQSNISV